MFIIINFNLFVYNIKAKIYFMINDDYIVKKLFTSTGSRLISGFQKIIDNNEEIKKYLLNRYEYSDSFAETLWRIKLHIENRPTCVQCGKPVKYYKAGKFSEFCSIKCAMNSDKVKQHCKDLLQEKYGVDNVYQLESVKNKIKQTCIEKYGVDNYRKTEESKIKIRETSLKRYGTEYPSQSQLFKDKVKNTNREKYGYDYGLQSPEIKQKSIDTCREKYGSDYYFQSNKFKELFNDKNFVRNAKLKEYETKKKNGSFKFSKSEKLLLDFIKEKYPDTIYQYSTDPRYPFNCDFYIPSLDLFIEYNGHWTHGPHLFDKNNEEDLKLLEKWQKEYKIKGTKGGGIDTWTKRDPLKLKTAKENNLNYLIIWHKDFSIKNQNFQFIENEINKYKKRGFS